MLLFKRKGDLFFMAFTSKDSLIEALKEQLATSKLPTI